MRPQLIKYSVSLNHIDTCHADSLIDHHNRVGECLFGVYVDSSVTYGAITDFLLEAWEIGDNQLSFLEDDKEEEILSEAVIAVITAFSAGKEDHIFAPELEDEHDPIGDESTEYGLQAWFLISFEKVEPPTRSKLLWRLRDRFPLCPEQYIDGIISQLESEDMLVELTSEK